MAKLSGFMAIRTLEKLKEETTLLYEIARYLKDSSKPEFSETVYNLANSKKAEKTRLERILMEIEIEI